MTALLKIQTREPKKVLVDSAKVLARMEKLRLQMRDAENEIRMLCREYDRANNMWGCQAHHLRRACEEQGLLSKHL